jgi:hypothetical protein
MSIDSSVALGRGFILSKEEFFRIRDFFYKMDKEYFLFNGKHKCVVITDNDGVEFFIAKSDHTWHPF